MAKPKAKAGNAPSKLKGTGKALKRGTKRVSNRSKTAFKKKPPGRKTRPGSLPSKKIDTTGEAKLAGEKRTGPAVSEKHAKKCKVSSAAMATRKERRVYRKQQRSDFEMVRESKIIWEHLRPHKATAGKVLAQEEIMALAKGHFRELSLKHDTARVVQSCLKNGSAEHRTSVFTELKDDIVELSKTRYSKFVVKALLKYCSKTERAEIISSLYGHVRRLIRHAEAGEVVETAYNEFANAEQRNSLVQEFYGTEFALFKTPQPDNSAPQTLGMVLAATPDHRGRILRHMKDSLFPLLEKTVVRHSIVHKALLDYLTHCSVEARAELIEGLREKVVHILHTRVGSKVGLQCIWHGTTKDRKIIVKSLKGLVCKVCREENGHLVMLGLFETVDDTVLLRKLILAEMCKGLSELTADQYGRKVLLHLLTPRSPRHFPPQYVALLSPGDGNAHSKKAAAVRSKELLEGVATTLLSFASAHVLEWAQNTAQAPLLLEMATSLPGDLSPLYEPLLAALSADDGQELIEHPCAHWVVKKLIVIDSKRGGEVKQEETSGFVRQLVSRVSAEQLCAWASSCNRGGFVVSALLGVGGEVGCVVREMLAPLHSTLADSSLKGHQAIWNALTKHEY